MGLFGKTERIKEKIAEELSKASQTNNGDVHVIPTNGEWAVRKEDSDRAVDKFGDKSKAIERAENLVSSSHSRVIVHNYDGTVSK